MARRARKPKVSKKTEDTLIYEMDDPKLLNKVTQIICKTLGKPLYVMGEGSIESEVRFWLPSGSSLLDFAMGGGYPAGRLIEIMGEDRRGKTSFGLSAIAQCQKLGGHGYYVDTEGTFDIKFATMLGVDIENNFVYQLLDNIEECSEFIKIVKNNLIEGVEDPLAVVVIDSIANAGTLEEVEYFYKDGKEYNIPPIAPAARKLGREFRTGLVRDLCKKGRITLIFINQLKESPLRGLVSYGGRGIKYQASIRLRVDQKEILCNQSGDRVGIVIEADILKNKVSAPFKTVNICFYHKTGIDNELSVVFFLEEKGLVGATKVGGWVTWKEVNMRRSELVQLFKEDPSQYREALELVAQNI